jgi:hypothetical protein
MKQESYTGTIREDTSKPYEMRQDGLSWEYPLQDNWSVRYVQFEMLYFYNL